MLPPTIEGNHRYVIVKSMTKLTLCAFHAYTRGRRHQKWWLRNAGEIRIPQITLLRAPIASPFASFPFHHHAPHLSNSTWLDISNLAVFCRQAKAFTLARTELGLKYFLCDKQKKKKGACFIFLSRRWKQTHLSPFSLISFFSSLYTT
ncbi:unnamed protein product [Citrullus colocynthis]|uniref:Uncharacterized protein n=1 Tax=Citrullus colocynthis TaxID=252529 RepID=A0ABP0ZC21_9ROSI